MTKKPATAKVVQAIAKAPDLECHVRVVEIDGVKVVELRDYIPSLQVYGRGYWIPLQSDDVFSLINGLTEVVKTEAM